MNELGFYYFEGISNSTGYYKFSFSIGNGGRGNVIEIEVLENRKFNIIILIGSFEIKFYNILQADLSKILNIVKTKDSEITDESKLALTNYKQKQ
jgi:hypothetical protein